MLFPSTVTTALNGRLQLQLWGLAWRRLPRHTRQCLEASPSFTSRPQERSFAAFAALPRLTSPHARASLRSRPPASVVSSLPSSSLRSPFPGGAYGLTQRHPRRGIIFRFMEHQKLKSLEMEANQGAMDANKQYRFLKELGKSYPEAVITRYEGGRFAVNEGVTKEYLKALAKVGKLDSMPLRPLLQPMVAGGTEGGGRVAAGVEGGREALGAAAGVGGPATSVGAGSSMAPAASALGGYDPSQPLYVTMVEPGFKQQLWRTFRFTLFVFLVISGLSAMIDDKGISSKLMMSTNLHMAESSDKRFSDVMGVDEAKQELEEIVLYLKDPSRFTRLGGKLPKGLLLLGPPGTGKTLLARAIAGEAGVPFFYASGSEFEEMYVGVGARRVRDLFEAAKKRAPCIIFVDEIDAIGGARHLKDQQAMKMTLNQLLVELDGFEQNKGVIIIGATNFPQSLDEALLRPGRFDKHVQVPLPDILGRKQILELYVKKIPTDSDVNMDVLARGTPGMSGAELSNLINEAALKASIDGLKAINMATFEWAKDKIMMGSERRSAVISKETATVTAYHEGGHALVALKTGGADPVYKATIMPRGQALGMVTQLPDGDQTSMSKKQIMARLDVCMGGRVAEELIFGAENVTSGASSDIQQATRLARAMVTQWGMSEAVGLVFHAKDGGEQSPETRAAIDREVKAILDASHLRAKELLVKHKGDLDLLAKALLDHETLTGPEIVDLLAGKKLSKPKVAPRATMAPPSPAATPSPGSPAGATKPGILKGGRIGA
ncbi:atp-dependent zinc metalloprotease ftsh mitochondrial-like protein [Nannochloropsis gaditana]|uniref:Atp-dependent zinc metalloprotease ftsh mitochondrial-like protein n=1 Tax=Nannochloropsis gaditana TaxID=72520 RepID=W7TKG2_9STRA|nr:atp-dependent zinc metalloprotease ftsh mitochondrial-like protein [Nannochloropsis gaditana]